MEAQFTIECLLFNPAPKQNRIWGMLRLADGRAFTFWRHHNPGSRTLFKLHRYEFSIESIKGRKRAKGFEDIAPHHYAMIRPGFMDELEAHIVAAILADEI